MPVYYTMDVYKDNCCIYSKHCKFVNDKQAFAVIRLWSLSNPNTYSYRNINKSNCAAYAVDEKKQCDFTELYLELC